MKVKFTDPQEFIDELHLDGPPSKVLRLTKQYKPHPQGLFQHVSVIATFVNERGEVVELNRYVGDHMGKGFEDRVTPKAKEVMDQIEAAGREKRLDVRPGRFDDQ